MGALKAAGAVGSKAGRVILYKVTDVAKMFSHWRVPIPQFMEEIINGKVNNTSHCSTIVFGRVCM